MAEFQGADLFRLDDLLAPEDLAVRDRVRKWVGERFMPLVQKHWRAATFPFEVIPEVAQFGAYGGNIQGYGCAGLTPVQYGLVMQELERGDSGLRTLASVQGALGMNAIHLFGSEEQKQQWLPKLARGEKLTCFGLTEPEHGSDPGGMETTALKTPSGFRLNGRKIWIGNAKHADVAVIWAKIAGEPGVDPQSPSAIRGFLIEKGTPGFNAEVLEGKFSLRIASTCRITLQNCEVPASALLPTSRGLKSPLQCLNHARYGVVWGVLGAAMACYDEARSYALRREQFRRSIASFQLVQRKLAVMLTELTKAQLLAFRLAQLKAAGTATHVQISVGKRNNVATAMEIARTAREILGAIGILDEFQSFRHMCNLESVYTYEGTDDMHLLILGEHITGMPAFA